MLIITRLSNFYDVIAAIFGVSPEKRAIISSDYTLTFYFTITKFMDGNIDEICSTWIFSSNSHSHPCSV
ncbi:MAG: hypothetical protein IPN26_15465 [Bacteroidetes bacterium]|nr:hypothetical protein [Bacteroidota bacterium]